jgi:hypothetical protein
MLILSEKFHFHRKIAPIIHRLLILPEELLIWPEEQLFFRRIAYFVSRNAQFCLKKLLLWLKLKVKFLSTVSEYKKNIIVAVNVLIQRKNFSLPSDTAELSLSNKLNLKFTLLQPLLRMFRDKVERQNVVFLKCQKLAVFKVGVTFLSPAILSIPFYEDDMSFSSCISHYS